MRRTTLRRLVAALQEAGMDPVLTGESEARAYCPAHQDLNRSLGLALVDGSVMMACRASCTRSQILEALGLQGEKANL